jgi:hypothetical protein
VIKWGRVNKVVYKKLFLASSNSREDEIKFLADVLGYKVILMVDTMV